MAASQKRPGQAGAAQGCGGRVGGGAGEHTDINRLRWRAGSKASLAAALLGEKTIFTLCSGVRKEGRWGTRNWDRKERERIKPISLEAKQEDMGLKR